MSKKRTFYSYEFSLGIKVPKIYINFKVVFFLKYSVKN